MIMFNRVAAQAAQFDVIHFHTDYLHFASVAALARPMLTTLHGRLVALRNTTGRFGTGRPDSAAWSR
jgi:hypothetical protein